MNNSRHNVPGKAPQAPYSKVAKTQSHKKPSLITKIKSFFNNENFNPHKSLNLVETRHYGIVRTPGGFYNQPVKDLVVTKRRLQEPEQNLENSQVDDFDEANASNSALATFFREKGGKPLSDVEYEGVMSLMRKGREVSSDPYPMSEFTAEASHMQEEHSAVLKSATYARDASVKTPSFIPKYDDISDTANSSLRSISSTSLKKARVFDYSNLPSPYGSSSYRHSAADVADKKRARTADDHIVRSENPAMHKLSNTASALISLLDSGEHKSQPSGLANPYTSRVSEFKKFKKPANSQNAVPMTPSKGDNKAPASSIALSEVQLDEGEDNANVEKTTTPQQFAKYKPAKASSLRTTVSAPKSPEKTANEAQPISSAVPQSRDFKFSYDKPYTDETSNDQGLGSKSQVPMFSNSAASKRNTPENSSNSAEISTSKNSALKSRQGESSATTAPFTFNLREQLTARGGYDQTPNSSKLDKEAPPGPNYLFGFLPPPDSGIKAASINLKLAESLRGTFPF
ncbi:LANO_0F06964g1_1 [Lachancea nothofagi CBS 11611]|uniref:LANO_0F06964g1_1 n=1 Tax=Lachancea nothofagi CBS 11611 TaxID=1266666 RepID=A0A1G4K8T0_9SACH|nr:LANO_0F06964g1_1 [Lachancea nothofagi CBS 11611]